MTQEELRTLTLFNSVENTPEINQRQLAMELGISLGLVNTYFQRVLKKGWIRAKKVKPRRWLYIITPQGVVEKSRLSLSYLNRTLESFRELKRKGDRNLRLLSSKGIKGIHLCGENDLTEVLSFCFTGSDIKLISLIPEKSLLKNFEKGQKLKLPDLNSDELIMIASIEQRNSLAKLLNKNGFIKNCHWIFFS